MMSANIDPELEGILKRAEELAQDFLEELNRCEKGGAVTERAKNIFHDVLIKLRSAVDIATVKTWNKYIGPVWGKSKRPKIYFPICDSQQAFNKKMTETGLAQLNTLCKPLYDLVLRAQPFRTKKEALHQLRDLANMGKHERLAIQTVQHRKAIRVTGPSGIIIYTEEVEFPSG